MRCIPTWSHGADEHPLAEGVAGDTLPELLDDADRLVPDDASCVDGVLASHDVEIGAADGRERDANDRLSGSGPRALDLLDAELVDASKDVRLHLRW
jgi:hypothetical protein